MAQDTLEIDTGEVEVETMVRKRKPPLSREAGCVQNPATSGVGRFSTPSYVLFIADIEESSEAKGFINMGDSVKDNATPEVGATESKFIEISPPICARLLTQHSARHNMTKDEFTHFDPKVKCDI